MKLSQSLNCRLKLSGILSFYLTEHRNIMSRRLHVVGSSIGLYFFQKQSVEASQILLYGLVAGYANAWVGHFVFEKISLPVLNNLSIALFLIGECCLMLHVAV